MSDIPIPLTVIGGYLGAGKTTLLNRILTGDHGRRLAVIVNDFGDVAVDEALLEPASGGVQALANGCVCCSAVDGLASALAAIRALDEPPEHLLVEVSGVGDPWAVAQWGRTPGFVLDGVIVIADAGQVRDWARDRYVGETVVAQLEVADLVLLSHVDVTPGADVRATVAWIAAATDAPVLEGTDVPLDVLIGRSSGSHGSRPAHAEHLATTVRPRRPRTRTELDGWLAAAPSGVVRVKGLVEAHEPDTEAWVAQRMGRRCEVTRRRQAPVGDWVVTVIATPEADRREVERWCDRVRE